MGTVDKPQLLFYQKMGELFYAIAAADKVVRKAEYDILKNIVAEQWKNLDDYEDPFHSDAAYQIEVVFDWFDYEQLDASDCFESFADYKKEWQSRTSKFSWYVFVYNEEERKWKNDKNKLPMLLGKILTELRINKEDLNEELIGFLTVNSKKNFVFKTKSVKTGKKEKGIECPSKGENRNTTLQRINYLARFIDDKGIDKYYMKDNSKKQKDKIYNTGTIKQYHPNDNYTLIPLTDYQLCVETEFLLRYLDENRENGKRWFFSTIEDSINNIKEIYK